MPVTLVQQRYSFITDKYTKNVSWCHVLADPHIQANHKMKSYDNKRRHESETKKEKRYLKIKYKIDIMCI